MVKCLPAVSLIQFPGFNSRPWTAINCIYYKTFLFALTGLFCVIDRPLIQIVTEDTWNEDFPHQISVKKITLLEKKYKPPGKQMCNKNMDMQYWVLVTFHFLQEQKSSKDGLLASKRVEECWLANLYVVINIVIGEKIVLQSRTAILAALWGQTWTQ